MQHPRIVTLLFTDVEGSTPLLGVLGDAFVGVIERQRAILATAAGARRGSGYPTGCDGCIFIFGSAGDAVAAAVEAQRALAAEPWPGGATVRVRMAIHAGEVAEVGDELYGMALHQASRIMAVTYGGQVVVSDTAVGLIEQLAPDISLLDLGVHRLRDIVRPVRLHQAIAEGIATSFPPLKTATSGVSRLPAPTTSFVGRERDLRELVDLLASRRLVTLTGVGGSGKTRLALEVARRVAERHRDGVRLVELAGLGTEALVPDAVLGALGMREPAAGTSATEALCAALADRALLLVLDNCEHVVAGVAALVSELLPACPALHVLATSREPLRLPGEVERPVPPLDRPDPDAVKSAARLAEYDAVRLLVERGGDVRPGLRVTDGNAAAVASICSELAGLPLAIELAAARLRTLSPEQVAARLGEQLDLLTHGGRSRPDRQQTMRATLDWSHQLLAPDEQTVFRRLSIFAGGFTLDAAEEVAGGTGGPGAGVIEALEGLVSRSLLELDHDRAEPRLRMLEPVRQYAAEQLRQAGERDEIVRRHFDWVVRLAAQASLAFTTAQGRWTARLRDEQDNIRQALEASLAEGENEVALRIAAALGLPWYWMGQPEGRTWVSRALDTRERAPDLLLLRAMALVGAGMLEENALDYQPAVARLREALALCRTLGARGLEGSALAAMGRAAWAIDVDARPPQAWFEEALSIFREVGEPFGIGWMLAFLADEAHEAGEFEVSESRAVEALSIGTSSGMLQVVAESRRILAMLALNRREYDEAERLLDLAANALEDAGDRVGQLPIVLMSKARLAVARGSKAQALPPLREALRLARSAHSGERMSNGVATAVHVFWELGRGRDAAVLLGVAEASTQVFPQCAPRYRRWFADVAAAVTTAGLDEHLLAGRSLSLERAADLALRVLDEEMALAATAASGGSEAAEASSTSSRGGRSQAFRER
jgi:predicted ATPase